MIEETVFVEVDEAVLPEGKDWSWLGDLNVVALRRGLTCEARAAVIEDVSRWWRRAHIKLVETG